MSAVAAPALQRIAALHRIEQEIAALPVHERLGARKEPAFRCATRRTSDARRAAQGPDGGGASGTLDYSTSCWEALRGCLADGAESIDNNHVREP